MIRALQATRKFSKWAAATHTFTENRSAVSLSSSHLHAVRGELFHGACQVSVPLGNKLFKDKVEWTASLPHNSPERYAASVCTELGLDWQDAQVIAAALRQQLLQVAIYSSKIKHSLARAEVWCHPTHSVAFKSFLH